MGLKALRLGPTPALGLGAAARAGAAQTGLVVTQVGRLTAWRFCLSGSGDQVQ